MRNSILFAFATLCLLSAVPWTGAAAQGPELEINALRTPTSPAFAILGIEPTAVVRPSTPRAVGVSLLSATERGTIIPDNYSVEFAPYWLQPRPRLTWKDYYDASPLQSLAQTFGISLATSRSPSEGGDSLMLAAIGFRVVPARGNISNAAQEALDSLDAAIEASNEILSNLAVLDLYVEEATVMLVAAADSAERAALQDSITKLTRNRGDLQRQWEASDNTLSELAGSFDQNDRVGLLWEISAAVSGVFPEQAFDQATFNRWGAWTTVGYRLEDPAIDFLGLVRYQRQVFTGEQHHLDLGVRSVLGIQRLSLSAELVNRSVFTIKEVVDDQELNLTMRSSSRITGLVEYRMGDDLFLLTGFGRDFQRATTGTHPLLALFGLQFHAGPKPTVPNRAATP